MGALIQDANELPSPDVRLPRLSFGGVDEVQRIVNVVLGDAYNAAGYTLRDELVIEDPKKVG